MGVYLKKVKVKEFAVSKKKWGKPPWLENDYYTCNHRVVSKIPNDSYDDVYTIVGKTTLLEGKSEYYGDGFSFVHHKTHQVYIVANQLNKSHKVFLDDVVFCEEVEHG